MKRINYIFATLLLILAVAACKPKSSADNKSTEKLSFSTAVEYNDFVIGQQEEIVKSLLSLADVMNVGTNEEIKSKYDSFGKQCKKSLDTIKKIDAFNNNTAFREESIKLFKFYYEIFEKDYKEMIDIMMKGDKISEADLARLKEIRESVTKRENERDGAFSEAQNKFAKENNIQIMPNDIQNQIDKK